MSIKNKTDLKIDNDLLYDDATSLSQKVSSPNQKGITNDQIDSFVNSLDRRTTLNSFPSPLLIILDYLATDQFILDLTAEPGTLIFAVDNILNVVSGESVRLKILKNANQSITLTTATGPVISKLDNSLQITGITDPVELFYNFLDGASGLVTVPNLQEVTDVDNVTNKTVISENIELIGSGHIARATDTIALSTLQYDGSIIGRSAAGDLAGIEPRLNRIFGFNTSAFQTNIIFPNASADHNILLPNKAGTFALLSDIVGGGGATVITQDEGVEVDPAATTLNFIGAGVTATDAGGNVTDITIPGGAVTPQNLDEVLGVGNTADNAILLTASSEFRSTDAISGFFRAIPTSVILTDNGSVNFSEMSRTQFRVINPTTGVLLDANKLSFIDGAAFLSIFPPATITGSKNVSFQDKDGTIALLSDITTGTLVSGTVVIGSIDGNPVGALTVTGGITSASKVNFGAGGDGNSSITINFSDLGTTAYCIILNFESNGALEDDTAMNHWVYTNKTSTSVVISIKEIPSGDTQNLTMDVLIRAI